MLPAPSRTHLQLAPHPATSAPSTTRRRPAATHRPRHPRAAGGHTRPAAQARPTRVRTPPERTWNTHPLGRVRPDLAGCDPGGKPDSTSLPRPRLPTVRTSQSPGHKTRDPIPKKGSVTKLETPSRKRVGHKTRHPIPKKGSVTKLETPKLVIQSGHLHAKCEREILIFLRTQRAPCGRPPSGVGTICCQNVQDCPWHERSTRRIVAADERKEAQTTRQVQRCADIMPFDSIGPMRAATT